jgi:hypothetical protein
MTKLKSKMLDIVDNIIQNSNSTNTTQLLGDSYFATQIYNTEDDFKSAKLALDNKLAIVNTTDCIKKLKFFYNIPGDHSLIVVKTDLDKSFDSTATKNSSNIVSMNIYDSTTKQKLNISICDDFEIKTPLVDGSLNMTTYNALKNQSIDIFDRNSTAFTSRCFSNIDPYTGYDTTLNYRINNYYQNKSIQCSTGCSYQNIDENNYINCKCNGATKTDSEFINHVGDFFIEGFSNINIGVVSCYKEVFSKSLNRNAGLYASATLMTFALIGGVILFLAHKGATKDDLLRTDCMFFDKDTMTVERYFGKRANKKVYPNSPTHTLKSENNLNKTAADIESSRELKDKHPLDINDDIIKAKRLSLKDNEPLSRRTTGEQDMIIQHGNFTTSGKPEIKENIEIDNTQAREEELSNNYISLRDYTCLDAKDIPVYDLRPTGTYIKDEIYSRHRLLSVLLKSSIMDPVIIRSTKLVFHLSSCMASSALCFTDSEIDNRANSPYKVITI